MKSKIYLKGMVAIAFSIAFMSCQKEKETETLAQEKQSSETSASKVAPDNIEVITFAIEDADGNVPTESQTLLYENALHNPVLAPDGHQVTFGEWSAATGTASVGCIQSGTHVTLHLRNLIPNGVYTAWTLVLKAPGYDGTEASLTDNVIGVGSLGLNDGSQNVFHASTNGTGQISRTVLGGNLSLFGSAGNCLLTDEFEFQFVILYHINQMTYGPMPGPDGVKAEQLRFDYKN